MPGTAADGIVLLDRPTTPLRVAEVLRERILLSRLPSGTRCAEQQLSAALGVSRNTLREAVRALFAELRLAFQLVPDPETLHRPFLTRDAEIAELALAGEHGRASTALRDYLDDAEARIVAAVGAG